MSPWLLFVVTIGTGLGTVENFDSLPVGSFQKGRLESWRWSPERREELRDASQLEVIDAAPEMGRHLRVVVRDPQIFANEPLPIARFSPHFPPEADVLRVRLKMISGEIRIHAGGPTAYYGNSDVFTAIHTVKTAAEPTWQVVEFSLNHPLWRNLRRAGASADAPRNYYNRWAQEPLGLMLSTTGPAEFLIDVVDLASRGEGKPFPQFADDAVQRLATIADFEDGRLDDVFNWYSANTETEWFDESWRRTKPLRFPPQLLTVVEGKAPGTKALNCQGPTAEEVHGTGVRTRGRPEANALVVQAWGNNPGESNTLIGVGPVVPIDFFVFVASPQPPFRWEAFAPPAELRAFPGPGFDYQLSYRTLRDRDDVHFAVYQTRRFLKPQTWTTLTIPAADFTCICGYGVDRERFRRHEPLKLGDAIAVGWLNPWCRTGRRADDATIRIDELAFAKVPGTPGEHRSYWQISSPNEVRMVEQASPHGVIRRMLLPNETDGLEP
jgi:hypothetical protein